MPRWLRVTLAVVVTPIFFGVLIVLVLTNTSWGNERVRRLVVSQANDRINGHLTIESLGGGLLSHADLRGVTLLDSARKPLFSARRVQVHYGLLAALRRHVVIYSLELDTPHVLLDRQPGSQWNFKSLSRSSAKSSKGQSSPPVLRDIVIHHGLFEYRRPWTPDSALHGAQRDSAIEKALRVSARRRTERVANGFQRVLVYRDIDTHLGSVDIDSGTTRVDIRSLSMIGEPYREPFIDVRSLAGVLLASKDSLWWRGARMRLPGSDVSGDGTIGFHKAGFRLDLTGSPVSVADLRWLAPDFAPRGGGNLRYVMVLRGDTATYAVSNADVKYDGATIKGNAAVDIVSARSAPRRYLVRGVDLAIANLNTTTLTLLAPSVRLKQRGILNGHVNASGSSELLALDANVTFDDASAGRSAITARGGASLESGVSARGLVVNLSPLRVVTLGLHAPLRGTVTGSATLDGSMKHGISARADLVHEDAGERSRVKGSGRYVAGTGQMNVDAELLPVSLTTIGKFAPKAKLVGSASGDVHARGTLRDLAVRANLTPAGGGSLRGNGRVSFISGKLASYDVRVVTNALDASTVTRLSKGTSVSGSLSIAGRGISPRTADAKFAADLRDIRYDTLRLDRLIATGFASKGLLSVDSLSATALGVTARMQGTIGLVDSVRGTSHVSADVSDLGSLRSMLGATDSSIVEVASGRNGARLALARADSVRRAELVRIQQIALGSPRGVLLEMDSLAPLRRDSLAGRLSLRADLTGNIKELGISAVISGSSIVLRGSSISKLNAVVRSDDVLNRHRPLAVNLDASAIQAMGMSYDSASASGTFADHDVAADVRVRQDALALYTLSGNYRWGNAGGADPSHVLAITSLAMQLDSSRWVLAHPAAIAFGTDALRVDSLDLRRNDGGRLFANGIAAGSAPIRMDITAERIRVSDVFRVMQRDAVAAGNVGLTAHITGTRLAPAINGTLGLDSGFFRADGLPDVTASFLYADQRLSLDATARDTTGRRVLALAGSAPVNLAFAKVTDSRKVAGAITADLTLDSMSIAALPFRSHEVEEFHGTIAGSAHVRGDWTSQAYTGQLALREAGLTLPAATTGMKVQHAVADVHFARDSIVLDSLVAQSKGTLRATGSVDIRDRKRPIVSAIATGSDLRVFDSPRGLVDVDARIIAAGPMDSIRVTGRAEMLGGFLALKQFRKDLLRVKAPGSLSFFTAFDTTTPSENRIRARVERSEHRKFAVLADVDLVVDKYGYYRNHPDASTGFYTGDDEVVRVHFDQHAGDQWNIGFVRVAEGVAIFRTRAFIPARGALSFGTYTGAPGIVQQVGERATWQPNTGFVPIQLLTGGTSTAPAVGLESGSLFPIRGRELNSYLTLGRSPLSLIQQSGSSLTGSEAWSGQLTGEAGALSRRQQAATALGVVLHDIGTGATKEYNLDVFSVSPGDVPTELVLGKTGGVRGAVIEGGRYITPDLYLAGQLHFTSGYPGLRMEKRYGTRYRLDVGFEPRFLFTAPEDLGITHPTNRTGAFGAFLTRLWNY